MAEENGSPKSEKLPYRKPSLRVIILTADEVMGVGCKATPLSSGASGNTCSTPQCSTINGS